MGFLKKVEDFWDEHHLTKWCWIATGVLLGMNVLSTMVANEVTGNVRKELQPIKDQLIPPEG